MKLVAEVMTTQVRTLAPDDTLVLAAQAMDELNVGAVPVCDQGELVGIITDRDIAVRAVAGGLPLSRTRVAEIMSRHVRSCRADQPVSEAMEQMSQVQVRRLPVVDTAGRVVGIVSVGDLATKQDQHVDRLMARISSPSEPDLENGVVLTPSRIRAMGPHSTNRH